MIVVTTIATRLAQTYTHAKSTFEHATHIYEEKNNLLLLLQINNTPSKTKQDRTKPNNTTQHNKQEYQLSRLIHRKQRKKKREQI